MTFRSKARRAGWLLVIAAFAFGIVSAIRPSPTNAYGLISTRSIEASSSEVGATNVIYKVGFTTATSSTLGSILIRICANNPIMGDTCNYPSSGFGFNWNSGTLSVNNITSTGSVISSLTVSASSTSNYLLLTRTPGPVGSNVAITFELGNGSTNGVTNPAPANTTYYARILLFASSSPTVGTTGTAGVTSSDTSGGGPAYDAGGVAMSTTTVLNVTAKVQEQLTFCVYTAASCAAGGNPNGTAINLGDPNNVLAATNQAYTDASGNFQLASNALNGVAVRLKGDTLTSGTFTITPDGNTCVADSTSTSVEQFGIRVVSYGTGQFFGDATAGSTTPTGSTNDFSCASGFHKFDPAQTNTTYGQPFVRTIGATDPSITNFELEAKASSTTEAGVYTTKLQFIATATY